MTDKKISELASNGTLTGSELVELVQSGSNVNALLSAIKTFITTGYLTSATAASTYATIAQAKTEYLTIACSDETTALTAGADCTPCHGAYTFFAVRLSTGFSNG